MGIESVLDKNLNIIYTKASGKTNLEEIRNAIISLPTIPGYDPTLNSLWDFTEATLVDVNYWKVKELADYIKSYIKEQKTKRKIAYLVTNPYHYGLTRMYLVFVENDYIQARIFKDKEKAIEWLTEK